MTTLTKEPVKGKLALREETSLFHSFQQEMNHLFDEFRHGFGYGFDQPMKWLEPFSEYNARVDVKDSDKEIVVSAEVPGVDMKDIDVEMTPNGLTIKGEKRQEKEEKDKGYYKMERSYGSFYRLVPIPCEVDKGNIGASYKDGVLKVTLSKTKQAAVAGQKITVKAG
jgi:HSP20 family protein